MEVSQTQIQHLLDLVSKSLAHHEKVACIHATLGSGLLNIQPQRGCTFLCNPGGVDDGGGRIPILFVDSQDIFPSPVGTECW